MAHYKKSFPSRYLQVSDLDTPIETIIKDTPSENELSMIDHEVFVMNDTGRTVDGFRWASQIDDKATGAA